MVNAGNGIYAEGAAGPIDVAVDNSVVTHQATAGLPAVAAGGSAKTVVSRSTLVDNASVAFYQFGAAIFESRGDNTLRNKQCRRRPDRGNDRRVQRHVTAPTVRFA